MDEWIDIQKDEKHVAKERQKASDLKKTNWWKDQINRGMCHYCKGKFKSDELTMDHVVPLSRGGRSNKGNVVPCCKDCNSSKKYFTPVELILKDLEEKDKN